MDFVTIADGAVCGVDEAGRGPLAGPVVAAAVILNPDRALPEGLNDSKKLSAAQREKLAEIIKRDALAYAIAEASHAEIDQINILQASLLAMKRAVEALTVKPSLALIDGNKLPQLACRQKAVVGGDGIVAQIAAASILAKTYRDEIMMAIHNEYSGYGFDRHMGYPTALHMQRLKELGPCPFHRLTFKPVAKLI